MTDVTLTESEIQNLVNDNRGLWAEWHDQEAEYEIQRIVTVYNACRRKEREAEAVSSDAKDAADGYRTSCEKAIALAAAYRDESLVLRKERDSARRERDALRNDRDSARSERDVLRAQLVAAKPAEESA